MRVALQLAIKSLLTLLLCQLSLLCLAEAGAAPGDLPEDYSKYDWYPKEQLPEAQAEGLPVFCPGDYLIPEFDDYDPSIASPEQEITLTAERSFYSPDTTLLQGNVELKQGYRRVLSDQAAWQPEQSLATFENNVRFRDPGLLILGDWLEIQTKLNELQFDNVEFVFHETHMRGQAKTIKYTENNYLSLQQSEITFCDPSRNDWSLRGERIRLDREAGFGSAYHSWLRLGQVPVFYFPYYRFPIDDRRLTGFLDPVIKVSGQGLQEISTPIYINLATNYDDTLTPRYLRDRGLLMENEFRFLHQRGAGVLNTGFLSQDRLFDDQQRWLVNATHNGNLLGKWQHLLVYNNVSDDDYFSDLSTSLEVRRQDNLERSLTLTRQWQGWQLQVRNLGYKTIDPDIGDADKPFQLLPAISANRGFVLANQLDLALNTSYRRFSRNNNDISGIDRVNAQRLSLQADLNRRFDWPWAFVNPWLSINHSSYSFIDNENPDGSEIIDAQQHRSLPTLSLDSGLFFDRSLVIGGQDYLQTLEPRLFYLYTPYVDQTDIPVYDTSLLQFDSAQLYRRDRFSGNDRIGDTHQITLGVTTRFINARGLERLSASIGRIFYAEDRRVSLSTDAAASPEAVDLDHQSPIVAQTSFRPGKHWALLAEGQFDPSNQADEQRSLSIRYNEQAHWLLNLSYRVTNYSENSSSSVDQLKQADLSFVLPIGQRWHAFGRWYKDLNAPPDNEDRLESLIGLEFESCCWRTQIFYRETLDTDGLSEYGTFISLTLKGLGTFGGGEEENLANSIPGYNERFRHDFTP